jgi:hypothetical protein
MPQRLQTSRPSTGGSSPDWRDLFACRIPGLSAQAALIVGATEARITMIMRLSRKPSGSNRLSAGSWIAISIIHKLTLLTGLGISVGMVGWLCKFTVTGSCLTLGSLYEPVLVGFWNCSSCNTRHYSSRYEPKTRKLSAYSCVIYQQAVCSSAASSYLLWSLYHPRTHGC